MSRAYSNKAETGSEKRPRPGRNAAPPVSPALHSLSGILALQRTVGNRAVRRLATGAFLQPKLQVGPAGDPYEREADRVADEVMRNLSPVVPREDAGEGGVRRSPVETTVGLEGGPVDSESEAKINRHRGGGSPLPGSLQQSMGQRFGADFGGVRVHIGPSADALAGSLQARAFTTGSDIFLARGQYRPETVSGQRLLAHELTHTLQQGAVARSMTVQRLALARDTVTDRENRARR